MFRARVVTDEEARTRLRTGKTDVIVAPGDKTDGDDVGGGHDELAQPLAPRYEYRFDSTRPQSVLARSPLTINCSGRRVGRMPLRPPR